MGTLIVDSFKQSAIENRRGLIVETGNASTSPTLRLV